VGAGWKKHKSELTGWRTAADWMQHIKVMDDTRKVRSDGAKGKGNWLGSLSGQTLIIQVREHSSSHFRRPTIRSFMDRFTHNLW
jgi:hypothetical protein